MRRLFNFLGVIAIGGLVFALAPTTQASAKAKSTANTTSSSCGSDGKTSTGTTCNCPPHYAFIAFGNGEAVDDINFVGCYDPTSTDPLIPNDEPELTCPTPGTGSAVNLACGCILAGGDNPSPGTDVLINGDTDLGNWKITKLEANFAFGDNDSSTFWIGNPNGSGAGVNGGRCYGAAGFATMQSTSGSAVPVRINRTFGKTGFLKWNRLNALIRRVFERGPEGEWRPGKNQERRKSARITGSGR